jgi:hypothetical protein
MLGKAGDGIMLGLVLECGIFLPIEGERGNFYQLSGEAGPGIPYHHRFQQLSRGREKGSHWTTFRSRLGRPWPSAPERWATARTNHACPGSLRRSFLFGIGCFTLGQLSMPGVASASGSGTFVSSLQPKPPSFPPLPSLTIVRCPESIPGRRQPRAHDDAAEIHLPPAVWIA